MHIDSLSTTTTRTVRTYAAILIRVDRRSTPGRDDEGPSLAELLNVSDKTAWRAVRDGLVESRKVMGRRMVLLDSVATYLGIDADELRRRIAQAIATKSLI